MMIRRCAVLVLVASAVLAARAEVAIPQLSSRVTDLTGTLSGEAVNRVESKLAAFEVAHHVKVAVLIVPTTQPYDIDQYPLPVPTEGVVLVVAKNDRRVHIDAGAALSALLPEPVARRIVGEALIPHFETGDFDGGVEAGVESILTVLRGERLPEADARWAERQVSRGGMWLRWAALGLAAVVMMGCFCGIAHALGRAARAAGIGSVLRSVTTPSSRPAVLQDAGDAAHAPAAASLRSELARPPRVSRCRPRGHRCSHRARAGNPRRCHPLRDRNGACAARGVERSIATGACARALHRAAGVGHTPQQRRVDLCRSGGPRGRDRRRSGPRR